MLYFATCPKFGIVKKCVLFWGKNCFLAQCSSWLYPHCLPGYKTNIALQEFLNGAAVPPSVCARNSDIVQDIFYWTQKFQMLYIFLYLLGIFPKLLESLPSGKRYVNTSNSCVKYFGILGKIQAKFYAVLIKSHVILQFFTFYGTFGIFNFFLLRNLMMFFSNWGAFGEI